MKAIEYMSYFTHHTDEDFGWCSCRSSENGRVTVAVNTGCGPIVGLMVNGNDEGDINIGLGQDPDDPIWERIARVSLDGDPDANDLLAHSREHCGESWREISDMVLTVPVGCSKCPWFFSCDAMRETLWISDEEASEYRASEILTED